MKNGKVGLVLFGLALVLSACEGNTDRIRIVKNVTDSELTVYTMSYDSTWSSIQIPSGKRETVVTTSQRGGSEDPGSPLLDVFGLIVVNANQDTLKTDLNDANNLVIYSNQIKKAPSNWEHEFVLNVDDADFD